jgi:hypothetical protein
LPDEQWWLTPQSASNWHVAPVQSPTHTPPLPPPLLAQVLSFDESRAHDDGSCVAVAPFWKHAFVQVKSAGAHAARHALTSNPAHFSNDALVLHP